MLVAPVVYRRVIRLRSDAVLVLEYGRFAPWPQVGLVIRVRKVGCGGMASILTLAESFEVLPGYVCFLLVCAYIAGARWLRG